MRIAPLLFVLACGCNQILGIGDLHVGGTTDGAPIGDGRVPDGHMIDASPIDATPNVSTELGKLCPSGNECGTSAPDCIMINGSPTTWCTVTCGSTNDPTTPPSNGDAICANAYNAPSGTPRCALYTNTSAPYAWYCAVTCGDNGMGMNFGNCPTGLACNQNVCQ